MRRAALGVALLLLVSQGCARARVQVYYATDRASTGSADPKRAYRSGVHGDSVEYGRAVVKVPAPRTAAPPPPESPEPAGITRLGWDAVADALARDLARSPSDGVLVFLHGFNTSFRDGAVVAALLRRQTGFRGPALMFSWPSHADPDKYRPDHDNALRSLDALHRVLRDVVRRVGAGKVSLVAHSMGSDMVGRLADRLAADPGAGAFRHLVFVAADADREEWRARVLAALQPLAADVTLYVSGRDNALKISHELNDAARAGQAGDEILLARGATTIDASKVSAPFLYAKDVWGYLGGHWYLWESFAMQCDLHGLLAGLPAEARRLDARPHASIPYWRIPGRRERLSACPAPLRIPAGDVP